MNSFFAKQLAKKEADLMLLKGVIAELEGVTPAEVKLAIEPLDGSGGSIFNELLEIND